jgi:LacI family transcriptional regulator
MHKEITIYDLAKKLSLHPATISRALKDNQAINKNTRKKVAEMAEEMGYQSNNFASNLRKKKTSTIGVIIPRLNSHFVSSVLAAMEKIANDSGYNIIISQSMESVGKEIVNAKTDVRQPCRWLSWFHWLTIPIILITLRKFTKKGIPVIFFDRVSQTNDSVCIVIDNYKNAYEGHYPPGLNKVAAVLCMSRANLKQNVYSDRFNGYKKALKDAKIPFDDKLLISGELNEEAGTAGRRNNPCHEEITGWYFCGK